MRLQLKLKLKAKLYQYTQIYLAQKEEDEALDLYIKQNDIFKNPSRIAEDAFDVDMFIGSWQAKHGFYSTYNKFRSSSTIARLERNKLKQYTYRTLDLITVFFKQLRMDLF
jgi:hypothetical protein